MFRRGSNLINGSEAPSRQAHQKLNIEQCLRSTVLMITLLAGVLWSCDSGAEIFVGRVVGVNDGDTITVLDTQAKPIRVRLAGIDAPELGQPYSRRSKEFLAGMVFQRDVEVRSDKLDRYGRVVGKVMRVDLDVCRQMIAAGFSWHYKAYEFEQSEEDRRVYAETEFDARRLAIGLWSDRDHAGHPGSTGYGNGHIPHRTLITGSPGGRPLTNSSSQQLAARR